MQLHLARDNAGFLAWSLAPEGIPFWCLRGLLILEDLFESQIEFAEVILAKAILIPADYVEDETIGGGDGKLFDCVPFGVECLWDRLRDAASITKCEDEILLHEGVSGM